MDQNEYPRPDAFAGGPYPKDRTWGTVIMVLAALGVCCGIAGLGVGGVVGALGAAGGAAGAAGGATREGRDAAVAAGVGGGLVMLLSGLLIVSSILQMVGGYGIRSGLRWGFMLTGILAAISFLLNIPQALHGTGIVGMIINGVIAYYCWSRLSGKKARPGLIHG